MPIIRTQQNQNLSRYDIKVRAIRSSCLIVFQLINHHPPSFINSENLLFLRKISIEKVILKQYKNKHRLNQIHISTCYRKKLLTSSPLVPLISVLSGMIYLKKFLRLVLLPIIVCIT